MTFFQLQLFHSLGKILGDFLGLFIIFILRFQFSLCIEDLVPVALGRYIKALVSSMHQAKKVGSGAPSNYEHILEKMFALFIEHGNLWPELCGLPEVKGPETSDISLYGYMIH